MSFSDQHTPAFGHPSQAGNSITRAELARRLGAAEGAREPRETTIVSEREPARFMAALAEAVAAGGNVFLADPNWSDAQRAELEAMTRQTSVLAAGRGWLMIPSGGTSGKLKFARHDEETLGAAVRGFCAHFQLAQVNAIGVLPMHHVSGLMAWLRCALTGGEYLPWEWKRLDALEFPPRAAGREWVISLVPTQLQRLLVSREATAWLREFRTIFLGGGPAWTEILDAAARAALPVSLSYGMTETAAMVTALRPAEFLAGERSSGPTLPHARVTIGAEGSVVVGAESLFRGYYPESREAHELATEDLGRIDGHGHLHVLGRRDAVIITGGKKVHPAEVEAALRASGEFSDVAVIGVPDAEWGEIVVACYPLGAREPQVARATFALASYQRPKRFVAIPDWPRNAQGKVNRAALLAAVMSRR